MPPLRIGLVGLGTISRFYLAGLSRIPSINLAAVCDVDHESLTWFADQVDCYTDHRAMLRAAHLDGVVVTTPNDVHFAVCRDALAVGVPVCVEKPLATRLEDGHALVEMARTADLALFTAFHRRYNAAVSTLARRLPPHPAIRSVVIRYLERIEEHTGRDRWYLDPTRCGGGCVADNGPNAYDLARLFLGDLQVAEATIGRDAAGVDREAVVLLQSASGATARVELDWSYDGECKEVEIHLADRTSHTVDMLSGHPGFKASLWHEYVGVLQDFAQVLSPGAHREDGGLPALALVEQTYRTERGPGAFEAAPSPGIGP